ncbi:glycosyltransferase family 2 protein [Streptomyces calidiresistens]|uniref:GltA n=1 Tax=Streptomyces calidiresistens TaxID=1485586 RepID=A0A7W3T1U6_9ACTN|nr:glycosyltransferase family 2 protein [Streptomyces calidiresistens]MBB0229384.1 GltA [Streptomyces calidiresistens]
MTRTYSVITAVYDGGEKYLGELSECMESHALKMPSGWQLEWIVQEDGTTGRPLRDVPTASWVSTGCARRGGAAVARTMAMSRVTGEIVRTVDADDLLTEGALGRDIEALETSGAGWCISPALDLMPDGSLLPGPRDPAEGWLDYEALMQGYRDDLFAVVATHLAARTELLHALGGWPALPAWETIGAVLRCAAVTPGWMLAQPGGLYRKHSDQTTARESYADTADFTALAALVEFQAVALKATGWQWDSTPLTPRDTGRHKITT